MQGDEGLEAGVAPPQESGASPQGSTNTENTFNLSNSILGSAILAMSYAIAQAGLVLGTLLLTASALMHHASLSV
ncbi:hypothetical protein KIPB_012638 [Kipferlia bialata]|uniref:Amino acid transporter transmembrane domain-containing protein n=1 Tax=Kipferlia bialata TaxID=797122 RepID=A0A9K3D7U7_9EUKA|nr:hypothetical protein KIPB_012638 [Kipferlia bialata]|eukprot:g12638.t1